MRRFSGEVAEWSKAQDWKSCVLLVGTVGSNPTLSASLIEKPVADKVTGFFVFRMPKGTRVLWYNGGIWYSFSCEEPSNPSKQ